MRSPTDEARAIAREQRFGLVCVLLLLVLTLVACWGVYTWQLPEHRRARDLAACEQQTTLTVGQCLLITKGYTAATRPW